MPKRFISIGDKYEKLTVIADTGKLHAGKDKIFLCRCDCGNELEVRSSDIGRHTKSCGCIRDKHYKEGTYLPVIKLNKPPQRNNTSGHVGVRMHKGRWLAQITLQQKSYHLGCFDTYQEACDAREEAEKGLFVPLIEKYKIKGTQTKI